MAASMTKRERVDAVAAGQKPDRPPVSVWYHFPDERKQTGRDSAEAHIEHFNRHDLDYLKVMFDFIYPLPEGVGHIETAQHLRAMTELTGQEPAFENQYMTLRLLRNALGDVRIVTTVFNAWATLIRSTEGRNVDTIVNLTKQNRDAVKAALKAVTASLGKFARGCIDAGADGLFFSCKDKWVDGPLGAGTYDALVRESDRAVLEAVRDAPFNMLHICERAQNLEAFIAYPHVAAVNWADRECGPSIAYARDHVKQVLVGGIDHVKIETMTPQQCADQTRDAIRQAGDRPIMIGPGCAIPTPTDPAKIDAIRAAVEP